MKRDFDLIREILLKVESFDSFRDFRQIRLNGYPSDQVDYHVKLLLEADLLEASAAIDARSADFFVSCLTWDGHEFLGTAKDNKHFHAVSENERIKGRS